MHPLVTWFLLAILILLPCAVGLWFRRWKQRQFRWDVLDALAFFARRDLPLSGGLKVLTREWGGARGAQIRQLAENYEASGSLWTAMSEQPRVFSDDLRALIRAGEQAGGLAPALEAARANMGGSETAATQAFQRLIYPIALVAVVLFSTFFVGELLLPRFFQSVIEVGSPNPVQDADVPVMVLEGVLLVVLGLLAAGVRTGPVGRPLQWALRRLPVTRGYARARDHARWLRQLGGLLRARATLPEALRTVAGLATDGRDLTAAAERAEAGDGLPEVLSAALGSDAPRLAPRLLLTTASHDLPEALGSAATHLDVLARRRLGALGVILEPLPILLCGAVACSLGVAIFGWLGAYRETLLEPLWRGY